MPHLKMNVQMTHRPRSHTASDPSADGTGVDVTGCLQQQVLRPEGLGSKWRRKPEYLEEWLIENVRGRVGLCGWRGEVYREFQRNINVFVHEVQSRIIFAPILLFVGK